MSKLPLLLTLLALPAAALPQLNGPDVELTGPYSQVPGPAGRSIDMAYTKNGLLILAWIEYRGSYDDRIVVVSYDVVSGQWTLLSNAAYGLNHVLELAIAVPGRLHPSNPNLDRIYVAAHFAQNTGYPADSEWIGLISGPFRQPWATPNASGWPRNGGPGTMAFVGDVAQPLGSWRRMHPGVACVPTVPNDFTQYTVEVVFAYTEISSSEESILWSRSRNYGVGLEPTQRLTGPQSAVLGAGSSALDTGSFRHPSAASDDKNGALVVAFQDDTRRIVHVAGGQPAQGLGYSFGTPENDGRDEIAPAITAYDRRTYFTCLEGAPLMNGGRALALYDGSYWDPLTFRRLATLHDRAVTPGDLAVREGRFYASARCLTDNVPNSAAPVHALSGNTQPNPTVAREIVSDWITYCPEPRVAITPDSVQPSRASFAYSYRDWTANGGIDAGFLNVDL